MMTYQIDEIDLDSGLIDFFKDNKIVPDLVLGQEPLGRFSPDEWETKKGGAKARRQVVYRPEPFFLVKGQYGNKNFFKIKVNVLIDAEGKVRGAEPLTTTGHPQIDIMALKYVRGWIFGPDKSADGSGEWQEVEIILSTVD